MLSFFETDLTFGRSLIAVLGDTSDGANGDDVVCEGTTLALGNNVVMFDTLVMFVVDGVATIYMNNMKYNLELFQLYYLSNIFSIPTIA